MIDRQLRLREPFEIDETRARGKAYAAGPLVARVLFRAAEGRQNRYTVVAGKRVGNAVERNRAKRLVRESIRKLHTGMQQGYDIVVIVRGREDDLPNQLIAEQYLTTIFAKAALLADQQNRTQV